jgi:uncharacterized protein YjeT (DUF2065 family)
MGLGQKTLAAPYKERRDLGDRVFQPRQAVRLRGVLAMAAGVVTPEGLREHDGRVE